ncbi:GDP-mannose-dependent alpha-(1-2)-phosphatidylinositol mannosyltransferase [Planctomycetes bacterium Pla163]|uniref:GDP-mannose-dependent alpha-(1-2)-phosphatidylinositol mannosyltransferase n=1 Tax=Rohdeia mirabilis TaxID=2528008 RepID=A0A518CWW5_9BACT|nr:GDP-mannose-dependent alpha-(1-2)-phosphatidylinositol mannosyltransferase [Planctomycetes bacterium Pla163]
MRILYLAQRVPYPPDRGDKISSWHHIERLARDHQVTVAAFAHDQADREAAAELNGRGIETHTVDLGSATLRQLRSLVWLPTPRPLTLSFYGSRALQKVVDRLAAKNDVGMAFSSSMGKFLMPHSDLARVIVFAELDSDKWRQYAEFQSWPKSWIYAREHRTLFRFESALARMADHNVLVTSLEERIFNQLIPGAPSVVVRNGVDLEHYQPDGTPEPGHLVFVGVMDYYPNVQGCVWFVENVLPRLRERHPNVHLSIVGARPNATVLALGSHPGVEVTGRVDDPRDWLRRAQVSVAPLHIARGIQNKVLEAMAMGLPVVATTNATQGVGGRDGDHYLVVDDVDGQVAAISGLLEDPERAVELGRAGRTFVERTCDWERTLKPLDTIIQDFSGHAERRSAREMQRRYV